MPKEALSITSFQGLYGAYDPADLQPGMAAACEGLDPTSKRGLFTPLPEDLDIGSAANVAHAALFADGTYAVVSGSGNISLLSGLDSNSVTEDVLMTGVSAQASSSGASVHLGQGTDADPVWVGDPGAGDDYEAIQGTITNPVTTLSASFSGSLGDNQPFIAGTYRWKVSLVYDNGLQESTLSTATSPIGHTDETQGYATVSVSVTVPSGLTDRVTGVALYRAQGSFTGKGGSFVGTPLPVLLSGYVFVEVQDYTGPGTYNFVDSYAVGALYEQRTGLPETLEHMDVRYGVSCVSQGFHVVGGIALTGEEGDYTTQLMRSQPYRFDMFDWSTDYLNIRMEPIALVDYRYRVYAFSRGAVTVVDVGTMTAEEPLEGIGTFSAESIAVTDRGMFFASENGIYYHDGTRIYPVGQGIYHNTVVPGQGYLGQAENATAIVCGYDARRDMFVVITQAPSGTHAWCVDARTLGREEVWSYFSPPFGSLEGKVQARDGRLLVAFGGRLYDLFGDDDSAEGTYRAWNFRSHVLRTPGRKATYYNARVYGRPGSLAWSEDGGSGNSALLSGTLDIQEPVINTNPTNPWTSVRELSFYITGEGGTTPDEVRQIDLLRRVRTPR